MLRDTFHEIVRASERRLRRERSFDFLLPVLLGFSQGSGRAVATELFATELRVISGLFLRENHRRQLHTCRAPHTLYV